MRGRMDPRMIWTLVITLSFIALVVAGSVFLVVLHTPIETTVTFQEPAVILSDEGWLSHGEVKLAGTMVTFRYNVDTPYFVTNQSSRKQGLFLNDGRLLSRLVLPWETEELDFVTHIHNGTRIFVNRNLSVVIMITPDGKDSDKVAIAPAKDLAEARSVIEMLISDLHISGRYANECRYLLELLETCEKTYGHKTNTT